MTATPQLTPAETRTWGAFLAALDPSTRQTAFARVIAMRSGPALTSASLQPLDAPVKTAEPPLADQAAQFLSLIASRAGVSVAFVRQALGKQLDTMAAFVQASVRQYQAPPAIPMSAAAELSEDQHVVLRLLVNAGEQPDHARAAVIGARKRP